MKQFKTFYHEVFKDGGVGIIEVGDDLRLILVDGSKATVQVTDVEKEGTRIGWDLSGAASLPAPTGVEIVTADAEDLDTLVELSNDLKPAYNARQVDVAAIFTALASFGSPTSSQNATAVATNLATSITLLNALKVNYNALQVDVAEIFTAHPEYGAVTSVQEATANAADQATSEALANSLKIKLNTILNDLNEIYQKADVTGFIPRSNDVRAVDFNHNDATVSA
jgi:hypothetical protein